MVSKSASPEPVSPASPPAEAPTAEAQASPTAQRDRSASNGQYNLYPPQASGANMPSQQVAYIAVAQPVQPVAETTAHRISRVVPHILLLLVCIAGLGLCIALYTQAIPTGRSLASPILMICTIVAFAVTFTWSFTELIMRCVRTLTSGISPVGHVLASVCVFSPVVFLDVVFILRVYFGRCDDEDEDEGFSGRTFRNSGNLRCSRNQWSLFIATAVLLGLVAIIAAVVFFMAYVDVRRRRVSPGTYTATFPRFWRRNRQVYCVPPATAQVAVPRDLAAVSAVSAPTPAPAPQADASTGKGEESATKEFYTPRNRAGSGSGEQEKA